MTPRKHQIVYLETQSDGRVFEGVVNTGKEIDCMDCACLDNTEFGFECTHPHFWCYTGLNPTRQHIIYKPTGFREPKR